MRPTAECEMLRDVCADIWRDFSAEVSQMSSISISLLAPAAPPSSSLSRSSSNSKPQSPSSPGPKVSVSLILAVSGSSP